MDKTDLDIMRLLLVHGRASYQSIGRELGLSSNTVKSRINKMITNGIIVDFRTEIKFEAFGYDVIFLLLTHGNETIDTILKKIELIGNTFMILPCIGDMLVIGIAIKGNNWKELIKNLLEPISIVSMFVRNAVPFLRLTRTDLLLIRYLLKHPRASIKNIANEMGLSTRTVKRRLNFLLENDIVNFTLTFDQTKLGYINFSMILEVNKGKYKQVMKKIYDELSNNFLLPPPPVHHESTIVIILYSDSIYSMDEMFKRVKSIEGVQRVKLIVPLQIEFRDRWFLKVIDNMLKINSGRAVKLLPNIM